MGGEKAVPKTMIKSSWKVDIILWSQILAFQGHLASIFRNCTPPPHTHTHTHTRIIVFNTLTVSNLTAVLSLLVL